jgi:pimeloyl-ACP methyl ester carboxylesterase
MMMSVSLSRGRATFFVGALAFLLAGDAAAQSKAPQIFYEQDGRGTAIVMIADWANDTSSWLHILPYLRGNHQLIRYDVRGQGRSEAAANGDYSIDVHRDDLGRVLDGLGLDRVHIVAAGLNARIAIAFAHASPDRVRSMALLNPHLAWTRDELSWWDRFLEAYDQVGEPSLGEYTALFIEQWFGTVFANREPWVTPFYDLMLRRQAPGALITSIRWWLSTDLALDTERQVTVPVLLVRSDGGGPAVGEPRLRQAFPRMRQIRINESGRLPQIDAPRQLGPELASLFAEIDRTEP